MNFKVFQLLVLAFVLFLFEETSAGMPDMPGGGMPGGMDPSQFAPKDMGQAMENAQGYKDMAMSGKDMAMGGMPGGGSMAK